MFQNDITNVRTNAKQKKIKEPVTVINLCKKYFKTWNKMSKRGVGFI